MWNLNDPVVTESHQLAKDLLDDLAVLTPSTKATGKPNKLDLAYRIVHNQQELAKNQARLAKTLAQADSIEHFSPQQIKAKAAELTAELAARGVIRLVESDRDYLFDHVARKSAALEELIQLGSKLDRSNLDLWSIYGFDPVDFTDQTARQSLGLPEVITPEMMTEVDARLKSASENTPKTSSKPSLTLFEAVSRDLVKPMPAGLLKSLAVSWYNQDLIQDLADDIDRLGNSNSDTAWIDRHKIRTVLDGYRDRLQNWSQRIQPGDSEVMIGTSDSD